MSKKLTDYFFKRKDKVSSTPPTEQSASVNDSSSVNNDANMLGVNNPAVNTPDVNSPAVNNPINVSGRMISEDIEEHLIIHQVRLIFPKQPLVNKIDHVKLLGPLNILGYITVKGLYISL